MKTSPFLTAKALSIGYHEKSGDDILSKNINFEVYPGELVCLIGPNGAGKSTLIRTIAGLQPSLSGSIHLIGKELTEYSPRQLSQLISLVLTSLVDVMHMTAYELVALGRHPFTNWLGQLTETDRIIIQESLANVGAEQFAERDINHLSDGERQKIMIARALAQQPKLMILDEPTAYLDFPNRVEILEMLHYLVQDRERAVLISTHDLNLAIGIADKLLIMNKSGQLSIGAPEDLILSGDFADAFNPNGTLNFDPLLGTFSLNSEKETPVIIKISDEVLANWTKKAVSRLGMFVADYAEIEIRAEFVDGAPEWELSINKQLYTVNTIYLLLQKLRELLKTH